MLGHTASSREGKSCCFDFGQKGHLFIEKGDVWASRGRLSVNNRDSNLRKPFCALIRSIWLVDIYFSEEMFRELELLAIYGRVISCKGDIK